MTKKNETPENDKAINYKPLLCAGRTPDLVVCWMCKGSGNLDPITEEEYCSIRHVTIERNDIEFECKDFEPCT